MDRNNTEAEECFSDSAGVQIVKQLAAAEGVDPQEIPPLTQELNLEALDTLLTSSATDMTISFSLDGYEVKIISDGTVVLN